MPSTDPSPPGPRTFLSYSWSTPEHEEWVLSLARDLRELRVDVVLDKWDLRDGDDPFPFMERIVTDPDLKKVVLVCDREYVRKADAREGGVGAEAQILTPALYRAAQPDPDAPDHQKAETRKFVALLREHAPTGERSTPAFYGGRIHIDASDDDGYGEALDRLARWIYDKPVHEKPPLGKAPAFVTIDDAPDTGTSVRQRRAIKALQEGERHADGAVDEYFETLAENLPRFDLDFDDERPIQQAVVARIAELKPVRDEAVAVFQALVRYRPDPEGWEPVHLFFQRCITLLQPDPSKGQTTNWSRDHFRVVVPELFLYAAAVLLRRRRYGPLAYLLTEELSRSESYRRGGVVSYSYLQHGSDAIKRYFQDEGKRWISPEGHLLQQRADRPGVPFEDIMQADLVLALRSSGQQWSRWWPNTLPYAESRSSPFDVFLRAASHTHFEMLRPVLGVETPDELRQRATSFGHDGHIFDHYVYLPALIGAEQIATQP